MSLCYDFEKWTMISLASVAISLTIGLVSLVYGQSLDDLRNQINREQAYRAELLGYIASHNITMRFEDLGVISPNWSDLDASELEKEVKDHMEQCKDGSRQKMIEMWERCNPSLVFPGNEKVIKEKEQLKMEMLGLFGHC
jgi:hypothetical protein